MKIENHLQPNCSDLVLMLSSRRDTSAIEDVVKTIRTLKLDIGMGDYNGQKATKLSPAAIALLMKTKENNGGDLTNVDKLQLVGEFRKQGMSEADITVLLKELKDGIYMYVLNGKDDVNFRLSDGYGSDGICVMASDCEEKAFPIIKKLQDEFGGEVYTVDGGHDDGWNEYLTKEDKDE